MKSIKNRSLSFAPETEKETFGEFVLQTNEVQAVLALTVSLYSLYKGKMDIDFLFKKTTLGRLISKFQVCIIKETKENSEMNKLLFILKDYNRYRCVIAHEMHLPDKRLNQKEAKKQLRLEKIF